MIADAPTPEDQLRFLSNLQRLLAEGQFVATYKFALLLSLADICVERGHDTGQEMVVKTEWLAEKFIQYYLPQVRPYSVTGRPPEILLQNTAHQSPPAVVSAIVATQQAGITSLVELQRQNSRWLQLTKEVRRTICKMPLGKLQHFGSERLCFLYDDIEAQTGRILSEITLKPGVMFCLRRFHGLVSDLVRGAWVRYIRRYNASLLGHAKDLDEFLFGSERADLSVYRPILRDSQSGECFYCRGNLPVEQGQVDHFIPWSLYPVDLGHNFVLAHAGCNGAKSDHLAAERHLEYWVQRNMDATPLNELFGQAGILHDIKTSFHIARWAYSQAANSNTRTWLCSREFEPLSGAWELLLEVA